MRYVQWAFWGVGLPLQFLVLASVVRYHARSYIFVLLYSFTLLASTCLEIFLTGGGGGWPRELAHWYWWLALTRQSGLMALVMSLVYKALPERRSGSVAGWMSAAGMIYWAASMYFCYNQRFNMWMTQVVRNVSFLTALLNLLLWGILIAQRRRDRTLLLVTLGLGLQMTGEAIGQSLRQVSRDTVLPGNLVVILTHFTCLYIWWRVFRRPAAPPQPAPPG